MRRFIKYSLILLGTLVVIAAIGSWAIRKGVSPLVNHEQIGHGKVIVVVDSTSPMSVASYLIKLDNGKLALIDAGMDPQASAIRETLKQNGYSESDVLAIFCTHSHDDHTGGASKFLNAIIYLMAPPPDLENTPSLSAWNKAQQAIPIDPSKPRTLDQKRITRIQDGETLEIGGNSIQAFSIPGHTPDSCAYLTFGVLFLGDSAAGQYNGTIGGPPPFVSVDRKLGQGSLKKLALRLEPSSSKIETLAFGHQGPVKGYAPLLSWAKSN